MKFKQQILESSAAKKLLGGSARGAVGKLAAVLAAFLLQLIVSRESGAAGAGYFFLAVSIVTVVAVLARLGIDLAVVRFFAPAAASGQIAQIRYLYSRLLTIIVLVGTILAALLYASSGFLANTVFEMPPLQSYLGLMWLGVVPLAIIVFHARLFQALKWPGLAVFSEAGLLNSLLVAALIASFLASPLANLWVYCAGLSALLLTCIFCTQLKGPGAEILEHGVVDVLRSAAVLFPAVIINRIVLPWAAVIMLGMWGNAEEVGIYSAATRIAMLVSFALIPVNSIAMPEFASMFKAGHQSEVNRLARLASLLALLIAAPIALVSFVAPTEVMALFGPDFGTGSYALVILVIGQLVNVMTGPASAILVVSGNESDQRASSFIGATLMLVAGVTLIPAFGMIGAAISAALAVAGMNITAATFVYKRFNILTIPGLGR